MSVYFGSRRHARGCDCDDCHNARNYVPPVCACCGGEETESDDYANKPWCVACLAAECPESSIGAPCRVSP